MIEISDNAQPSMFAQGNNVRAIIHQRGKGSVGSNLNGAPISQITYPT
jgi:hypothetical protein